MRQTIAALTALLIAAGILYVGNGLQNTLLAVRGDAEGFSLSAIGLLMSAYFVGFIAGCKFTPRMVHDVGHIRTFTALASVASASALAHAIVLTPEAWLALRAVTGFCFAGLAMVIESWINERATNQSRGRVLSVYRLVDLSAQMAGQSLLTLSDPGGFVLFAAVSILVSLALVPVALTTSVAPQPIPATKLDLRRTFSTSPLAATGAGLVGFANTSFWALGPVFVVQLGYSTGVVAAFMGVAIMGGALAQFPLGVIADRMDRRKLILVIGVLAAASGVFVALVAPRSAALMLVAAGLFGGFAMPLFGLCIAQANDHARPGDYVALNGGLLLLYGLGAVAGPIACAQVMGLAGTQALFFYTAAVHLVLVGYGLWRMTRRPPAPKEAQEQLTLVTPRSPAVFELGHPAAEPAAADGDGAAARVSGRHEESGTPSANGSG